jgi:glycosyltransferase involved in cell wall biosynthesis
MDYMSQQVKEGHKVSLLWPGEMQIAGSKTQIKKHRPVDGIDNYEVINPLPISFDEGIMDIGRFTAPGDNYAYHKLLEQIQPDVVHVHTLMGLHKSFLDSAREKGIRLVFTAHDFFPICPKVTMFRNGKICDSAGSCTDCAGCNTTALSLNKIRILQSPIYRALKDTKISKVLRKAHRDRYLDGQNESEDQTDRGRAGDVKDYLSLREYYYSMLRLMDIIHYNSSVTKNVYEQIFELPENAVIPISHSGIGDHRRRRDYTDRLRIRYLGPRAKGKGYAILNDAVRHLWNDGRDVKLDVHFGVGSKPEYMNCHERFSTGDLESIFNETDILVCPSIWYETFGYTVLEALSFGVPVIVSDTVGAKDIITQGAGIVIEGIDSEKLYDALGHLDGEKLSRMNKAIIEQQEIMTMDEMSGLIKNRIYMC